MQTVHLKRGAERRLRNGHLWVFSNEVDHVDGAEGLPDGSPASFVDVHAAFLGAGYYHAHTLIAGRILSFRREPDLKELLRRRLLSAIDYRQRFCVAPGDDSFRLVFSEGDLLPGLIVDVYGEWIVAQILTAGMELLRETLCGLLRDELHPRGIVFRNDPHFRGLEGLPERQETVGEEPPDSVEIRAEGLRFSVDLRGGQKTGHYFDQARNRRMFGSMVRGWKVLDAFCYSGGWSLQAAAGGAALVTAVDSSAPALELVKRNAALNGFQELIETRRADVLEHFQDCRRRDVKYDAVVLDPPAYAKSRKDAPEATQAYLRVNREAVRCLHAGGLLVTSSCSHHMPTDEFISLVGRAVASQGRSARLVHVGQQAPDHPVPPGLPEAGYLKCLFLLVE